MFAGLGLVQGVPSFMPVASADDTFSVTEGMLTVSSEFIQGGAILEIVVNDPDISSTEDDINDGAEIDIDGTEYTMNQAINGKWYLYVVDNSVATDLDDDGTGFEYGIKCTTGLGVSANSSTLIIPSGTSVWTNTLATGSTTSDQAGSCFDADNMIGTLDDTSGTTSRQDMTAAVLRSAPTLSDHDGNATDLGQRGHKLNASGYGSWPYILSIELNDDNIVKYGDDEVNVEFGNTDDEASISIANNSPASGHNIHLTITDPALNIDPTDVDKWQFDLSETKSSSTSVIFATNGTNSELSPAQQGTLGCSDNCQLTSDSQSVISGYADVIMTESASNSAVFESFNINGVSEITVTDQAAIDTATVFDYAGETQDMIIVYNDATIEFSHGSGDWAPTQVATITINDPDANKTPNDTDEFSIGDETSVIPTIIMGTPLTLAHGTNPATQTEGDGPDSSSVESGVNVGSDQGGVAWGLNVYNTTDTSERLRIIHNGTESSGAAGMTATWINVTTGHTRADLVNLPGTVVLSYDITGPAGLVSSTEIDVYVTDDGDNETDHAAGAITINEDGNVRAGVYDLDDGAQFLRNSDVSAIQTWSGDSHAGTNFVTVAFKMTHAAGNDLTTTADYAIAADFCNFDQNNGSGLAHNCIYRVEMEETGDNTGIFQGTAEYITMNNSTTGGAISGEHNGNDHEVESLLTDMGQDDHALIVLQDSVSGVDAIRVMYNDTDALQAAEEVGAQLDTVTHSGTADLDLAEYEAADMATITIVDADLNQDSAIRDTYQNSSTTFNVTVTGSDGVAEQHVSAAMTIIETTNDSGVFVGTFSVPDYNGEDIELTYYESRDAGGNAVEIYDTATVVSNDGSIALDRSVYPVPYASGDLKQGDDSTAITGAGDVTMYVTVSDSDTTVDTFTTGSTSAAGTVEIMLVEGTTTSTCFTAGSIASYDASGSVPQELGPGSEIVRDSSEYEWEFSVSKVQDCGANDRTVSSGDIIQVKYVDTSDSTGSTSTFYDSSTFDLRTGSLSVDKDVYVLGSDLVLTLTDPDLNLDASSIESYSMALIEWDSDADSSEAMNDSDNFLNNPSDIQETGEDTGVFQTVVTLPEVGIYNNGDSTSTIQTIDFGEAVTLTYADQGLSGEDQVGDDTMDVETYFSISNFGALVELDKAVYNWTHTVYVTITAPDHNTNSAG
jgi:hypothetical protein